MVVVFFLKKKKSKIKSNGCDYRFQFNESLIGAWVYEFINC